MMRAVAASVHTKEEFSGDIPVGNCWELAPSDLNGGGFASRCCVKGFFTLPHFRRWHNSPGNLAPVPTAGLRRASRAR